MMPFYRRAANAIAAAAVAGHQPQRVPPTPLGQPPERGTARVLDKVRDLDSAALNPAKQPGAEGPSTGGVSGVAGGEPEVEGGPVLLPPSALQEQAAGVVGGGAGVAVVSAAPAVAGSAAQEPAEDADRARARSRSPACRCVVVADPGWRARLRSRSNTFANSKMLIHSGLVAGANRTTEALPPWPWGAHRGAHRSREKAAAALLRWPRCRGRPVGGRPAGPGRRWVASRRR